MLWSTQLCREPHKCLKRPIKRRRWEERRVLITPEKLPEQGALPQASGVELDVESCGANCEGVSARGWRVMTVQSLQSPW